MDCIFCKIVKGEAPAHKVWEDDAHLAFLSIFPNTPGVTVVITKEHQPSYAFGLPDDMLTGMILAAKKVALAIDATFDDVGRTGLVLEGFGVDHVHAKLFPLHGTKDSEWKRRASSINIFFDQYPGYISSHDADLANDEELAVLAQRIRSSGS